MQNLSKDLSTLASVDRRVFDKLIQNANFCICDYLENSALNNEDLCEVDIGIGILKIKLGDDSVRYQFIPSQQLESDIVSTLENQQNFLVASIDSTLVGRLNRLYDNLL